MPKIYLVILNWNHKNLTTECLESVDKLYTAGYQLNVVVVDNASTDGSVEHFKKLKFKSFNPKVLENKENLGFAIGNNIGMKYALKNGADYILVMNNDVFVDKNLITELLKIARKYNKVGSVSPKIYFTKGFEFHKKRYKKSELGKVIWYAGGHIDWANVYGENRGVNEVDRGQYNKKEEIDFATGACVLFSTKALKSVGLYDPKYFMYLEDGDLSIQMKRTGWKVLYAPKAICWHKVAQSSGIGSDLNDYYITRNRLLFGLRWAPMRTKFALMRESWKFALTGRKWQKKGIIDFYLGRFGKGSWGQK